MSSRRTEWVKRLATLLASTILAVGLSELLFRAYEATFLAGEMKIGKHSVDLAGMNFNDTKVPRKRGPEEFRVLSFGDSFGYTTVKYPYSYHAILADGLNELGVGKNVRVVNLGEPSIALYQYIERYRFWSEIIEYDAVLFNVYLGNDIIDVALGHVADDVALNRLLIDMEVNTQTGLPRMRIPRKYGLRMLDYSFAMYQLWSGAIEPYEPPAGGKYTVNATQLSEQAYYAVTLSQLDNFDVRQLRGLRRGYEALIRFLRLTSEIRAQGKQVAVFLSPNESQVTPELRAEITGRFKRDLRQLDFGLSAYLVTEALRRVDSEIPLLDLRESFARGTDQGLDLYLGTNTHWSAEGNELAGRCLTDYLARGWFGRGDLPQDDVCPNSWEEPIPQAVQETRKQALREFLLPLLRGEQEHGTTVTAPLAALANLERLPGNTLFALTTINGIAYDDLGPGKTVPKSPGGLSLSGWAMDSEAKKVAGGVIVEVNGVDFTADYGLSRSDVATHFSDWDLLAVGFSLRLPNGSYGSAQTLTLKVKVISVDGEGYYESGSIELRLK